MPYKRRSCPNAILNYLHGTIRLQGCFKAFLWHIFCVDVTEPTYCGDYVRNGRFAFVIYDATTDLLFGARDRLGIKPFIIHVIKMDTFFASEIKILFESGYVKREAYLPEVYMYFTYRYVLGKFTIYKDIYKLPPAQAFEQIRENEIVEIEGTILVIQDIKYRSDFWIKAEKIV